MENCQLRTTILEVVDRLSDINRERLHFILANHVPRRIRDNSSTSGTLHLMESLFEQDKLSEQNFTILIDAFKAIKCAEGLRILRDHKRRVYENLMIQRNCAGLSLNEQITRDQEEEEDDKSPTQSFLGQISNSDDNSKSDESSKILKNKMNSVTIDVGTKSSYSDDEQPFYVLFRMNKCLFSIIGLLSVALVITLTFLIIKFSGKECTARDKNFIEESNQIKILNLNLNDTLTEKIEEIIQLKEEQKNLPIKGGRIFGGTGGTYFDDSLSAGGFQKDAYFDKIYVYHDNQGFEAYRFSYYLPNHSEILSSFQRNESFPYRREFEYDRHGIDRVEGRIVNKTFYWQNGTAYTKPIITSLRFKSFQHVSNPVDNETVGIGFKESFKGYKLGYVRGRSNEYIEQIQFVWYRM